MWTLVGFAAGLLAGYDWSRFPEPRFAWWWVLLASLVGLFVSILVAAWPRVREPAMVRCAGCGRLRSAESVFCPSCGSPR